MKCSKRWGKPSGWGQDVGKGGGGGVRSGGVRGAG